jgi:hypothetical protein
MQTKLADLHQPHVRDLLLDHVAVRGSGKAYDHSDYRPAMREATEAWAAHVERLVGAEGVSLLR